ncbi:MAG: hypothetical protein HY921_00225 [Elusimicrobia bacterium]|nr:hypothetical protein [Elusimicrobiota bacterium]
MLLQFAAALSAAALIGIAWGSARQHLGDERAALLALALLLAACGLRLILLDGLLKEPEHDAWSYALEVKQIAGGGFKGYLNGSMRRSPLFPLMAAAVSRSGLDPFASAKLLCNLFYLGLVLLTFLCGRLLAGAGAGLLAAGLLALSNGILDLGVKPYLDIAYTFFAVLSVYLILAARSEPRPRHAAALACSALAAVYARPEGLITMGTLLAANAAWPARSPLKYTLGPAALYALGILAVRLCFDTSRWGVHGVGGSAFLQATECYRLDPNGLKAIYSALDAIRDRYPARNYPGALALTLQEPLFQAGRLLHNLGAYLERLRYETAGAPLILGPLGLAWGWRRVQIAERRSLLEMAFYAALFSVVSLLTFSCCLRFEMGAYPFLYIALALGLIQLSGSLEVRWPTFRPGALLLIFCFSLPFLRHWRWYQAEWAEKYSRPNYPPYGLAWKAIEAEARSAAAQGKSIATYGPMWDYYLPNAKLVRLYRQNSLADLENAVKKSRPGLLIMGGMYHEGEEVKQFFRKEPLPRLGGASLNRIYPTDSSAKTPVKVFACSYPTAQK